MKARSFFLAAAVLAALAAPQAHALHTEPFRDNFVWRAEPDIAPEDFKNGKLGILLPSFGRGPLYLAYRNLALGPRAPEATPKTSNDDFDRGLTAWLAARALIKSAPPRRKPGNFRAIAPDAYGDFGNCPDHAFGFASATLQQLKTYPSIQGSDVATWVDAQDAVFEYCTYLEGAPPQRGVPDPGRPAPPQALDSGAPILRKLRDYQIAAASFYAGNFADALRRFDAIATDRENPQRLWAAHAAMRSILRAASLDLSYERAWRAARTGNASEGEKRAVLERAAQANNALRTQSMAAIEARARAMLSSDEFSSIHPQTLALLRQATYSLMPLRRLNELSEQLADIRKNPDADRALDDWIRLADRFLDSPTGEKFSDELRTRHAYFDWIRLIQACTDNPASPHYKGAQRCADAHQRALREWSEKPSSHGLVAVLMTATAITPALQLALDAALRVPEDNAAYFTLRYHAARLLRLAGDTVRARGLVDAALSSKLPSAGAFNLFRQERVALAGTLEEAAPYLLRAAGVMVSNGAPRTSFESEAVYLAADGDEIINRRLSIEEMLKLAALPASPPALKQQLWMAAWWRADLAGKPDLAQRAAQSIADAIPALDASARRYLAAVSPAARRHILVVTGLQQNVSPQVLRVRAREFARRRAAPLTANWWCSFQDADFSGQRQIERTPVLRDLSRDTAARDAELAQLRSAGSAPGWYARHVLAYAQQQPDDRNLRVLLQTVLRSNEGDCVDPDSKATSREAETLLQRLK